MRVLIAFLALLALVSCKKKDGSVQAVSGTIVNQYSGKPVSGATVTLKARYIQNGVYSINYNEVGSAQTDANGYYKIDFQRINAGSFILDIRHPNYYSKTDTISADDVNNNNPLSHSSVIAAKSNIFIHIVNVEPVDSTEKFSYGYNGPALTCDCCTKEVIIIYGAVDTTFGCNVYGDRYYTYSYTVQTPHKPIVQVKDSIFCPAGQTANLNVNY